MKTTYRCDACGKEFKRQSEYAEHEKKCMNTEHLVKSATSTSPRRRTTMADKSPIEELLRKMDVRQWEEGRCCGNCRHYESSKYVCHNQKCRIGKKIAGICDFIPWTASCDVCNFYESETE